MLFNATPDLDKAVTELMARFPTITFPAPTKITIDGIEALAVNGVPGIDPNVYIYLVANSHLYQIIYAGETLDDRGELLLRQLRFVKPVKALDSLGLKRAEDTLYEPSPYAACSLLKGAETELPHERAESTPSRGLRAVSGCADWPTAQLIQTPISDTANGNGYSNAGPSYYNQGAHQYCNRTTGLNDYYALDFPLRTGDVVYAPFSGTVKWVGWTCGGWSTLGKVVIVEKYVGTTKYWSMAAHLNSINVQPNDSVTISTVIGYAGRSGNQSLTYWSTPHLHQGIYANATLDSSCGGIYAGQSVQPLHVRYYRSPGGYYETLTQYQQVSW